MIERVYSKEEVGQTVAEARRDGKTVGFVPTMGALHEGHLSLVRAACKRTGFVAVSIFVNPTQFGPGEDFAAYPRDLERDLELLSAEGVDLAFTPSVEEIYAVGPVASCGETAQGPDSVPASSTASTAPPNGDGHAPASGVSVDPGALAERWEGTVRPGHFRGVATVVAKLLNIVRPDLAFFGEKDYQQLTIVRRMVCDLDVPTSIVSCPVVRDADGLALSSRNAFLSATERAAALALPRALDAAAQSLAWGVRSGNALSAVMQEIVSGEAGMALDYAAIVDPETLEPLMTVSGPARALIAGRAGRTRLIDTAALVPPPSVDGE